MLLHFWRAFFSVRWTVVCWGRSQETCDTDTTASTVSTVINWLLNVQCHFARDEGCCCWGPIKLLSQQLRFWLLLATNVETKRNCTWCSHRQPQPTKSLFFTALSCTNILVLGCGCVTSFVLWKHCHNYLQFPFLKLTSFFSSKAISWQYNKF
jgi:hypothetical protein